MNYTFKNLLTIACLLVGSISTAWSQATARIQVIHNSPTPTVDIYANGALLLNNFAFRTATPFLTVPANVTLNLGVGLGTSRSVNDTLVNFRVRLDSGKTYVVFANGIVGNATRPFTLAAYDLGRERSANANNVDVLFFHGSPDAPQVDILNGNSVLFDNISYGQFSAYASVPAATYSLSVTPGNDNTNRLATYNADFSFWKGNTAVVFASGFLGGDAPAFEPWVALSNGGTFPLQRTSTPPPPAATNTARLQIIHNSPTPTVDIYVNGALLLDNFAFRTATPYLTVPAGVTLNVGVGLGTSMSVRDTLVNFPVRLDSGRAYVVVANGIVGNATRPFTLAVNPSGRVNGTNANNIDVAFFHGSPDAPEVDILAGTSVLFDNYSYGRFAPYASVPATSYTLAVTPSQDNNTIVARYAADFGFWKGNTAVVFASGFLAANGNPAFEPWVALSNGGTFALRRLPGFSNDPNGGIQAAQRNVNIGRDETVLASPNPASDHLNIALSLTQDHDVTAQIVNLAGQTLRNQTLGNLSKGNYDLTMDLSDLPTGCYVLRVTMPEGIVNKKVMLLKEP